MYKIINISLKQALLCVLLAGLQYSSLYSQTTVEVLVDQPDRLEIIVVDIPFIETDTSVIFGGNLEITGGIGVFDYSWYAGSDLIGTERYLELPYPLQNASYTFQVKDANNCTAAFVVDHGLGVSAVHEEISAELISVYPNPASGIIIIDPGDSGRLLYYSIIGLNGSVMKEGQISGQTSIGIDFPIGTYLLRIENSKRELVGHKKIILL
jgi:hypothetical protein